MGHGFKPESGIEKYFALISSIPHGSGNESALGTAILKLAGDAGLDADRDAAGNIFIRKPATAGSEDKEPIMLAAHLDMVCAKAPGSLHDFAAEPLTLYVDDDGWLHADGTTLGADDGYGVAYILDILLRDDIRHPALECLLTTKEETSMAGAMRFDYSKITAKKIIGLDSFGVERNTVSSCMGRRMSYELAMEPAAAAGRCFKVEVCGLIGGHSAVDITCGRANALKVLGHTLSALERVGAVLVSAEGGEAENSIPRHASAYVLVGEDAIPAAERAVAGVQKHFGKLYQATDGGLSIAFREAERTGDGAFSMECIRLLRTLPNGVRAMDFVHEGAVACSGNLGILSTDGGVLRIKGLLRSNCSEWLETLTDEMELACEVLGGRAVRGEDTPGMEYRPGSVLRQSYFDIAESMLGFRPEEVTTHGGLEIGYFAENIQDADILTIGVDAVGAHSPEEAMSLRSFNDVYASLTALIEQLA
ncbi:MAG: M20/M25/M40 family metallo-hydrolase [Oscillospiraceae bacterium]